MTSDRLQVDRVGFFCGMVSGDTVTCLNMLRISEKVGKNPMDLAASLWGSFLPCREDSIPSWSQLLALNLFLLELVLLPVGFQSFLINIFPSWQRREVNGILGKKTYKFFTNGAKSFINF